MLFIPLPFVIAFLLGLLILRALRGREAGSRADAPFVLLLAAYAVQAVLIGLRWGYDVRAALPLQAILAAALPPLSWLAFRGLAGGGPASRRRPAIVHAAGPLLVALLMAFWPDPVDLVIIALFLAYGAALLWQERLGPDGLGGSRIEGAAGTHRALLATGGALVGSAAVDLAVSLDMTWNGGLHAGAVVAGANMAALLLLGWAASTAVGAAATPPAPDPAAPGADPFAAAGLRAAEAPALAEPAPAPSEPDTDLSAIAAALEALMTERRLYHDLDLNLDRIARRLGRPARSVSQAINRTMGLSVSQYVNNHRVAEACQLLAGTREPVTRILFEAGFQTKSNFNREFLRVTGTTPSAWRRAAGARPTADGAAGMPS